MPEITLLQHTNGILYGLATFGGTYLYKQVLADGSTYLFSYAGVGIHGICSIPCPISGSSIIETDVTDPRGNMRKVHFNSDGYKSSETFAAGKPEQQTTTYNYQQSGVNQQGNSL